MDAEIIAVGSELLTPHHTDTNSLFLTDKLNQVGIEVRLKTIVGDDRERLASVFRAALGRSKLIILTGGLGRDVFDFNAIAESVKGNNRDVIADFNRSQHDRIDLTDIDAKTGVAGNNERVRRYLSCS